LIINVRFIKSATSDILVELFTNLEKKEVEKVIYLLQGRVAPFYAPVEIGMADKMVAQAIALAYGSSKEDVLKRNDKTGDMAEINWKLYDLLTVSTVWSSE
jgi:DNA ligase-1